MPPSDPQRDPVVGNLRTRITEADRAILTALNERLELVRELREHKAASGWDFVDRGREAELVDELVRGNQGPLSESGLRELFSYLLALTKRETDASP